MKKHLPSLIFILLLVAVGFMYRYHQTLFYQPQSVHKWRQSDCASIALNYYQGGMHFFQPETHNLTSDGGITGKAFTSEIPILYYGVAALYKIFGYHPFLFRLVNLLIFFVGLFFFHRLILLLTHKTFWAVVLPLLFFTSPVLSYYGNNFLSNSSALAFSIMGWFYFAKYLLIKQNRWFYASMGLFFLAGAFKLTALMSLFAIGFVWLLEVLKVRKFRKDTPIFTKPWFSFAIMAFIVFIIGAWIIYAHIENTLHQCYYFSTTTFPIWDLSKQEILNVIQKVRINWWPQYYHFTVHLFLVFCMVFLAVRIKKVPLFIKTVLGALFFEALFYIILQFWTFSDHDYYTIDLFIISFLILVSTLYVVNRYNERWLNLWVVKILFTILLLFNIWDASTKVDDRYHIWQNDIDRFEDIYSMEPYLRQIGITPQDTVISIPDYCHATLYLMNQKGWTEYIDNNFNNGTRTYYNRDSAGINRSIANGAKYLIINGINELYSKPYLQSFCYHTKGRYKNVLIFDVAARDTNFRLNHKKLHTRWFCDAETVTADGKFFVSGNQQFEYGTTQSTEKAFSGINSCKLFSENPYGMTLKLKDIAYGESFDVSVWRLSNSKKEGGMVVSVNGQNLADCEIVCPDSLDWEKLSTTIFVTEKMVGHELVFFLYNPTALPAYFDDFEIIRYKSVIN
jgi:hypothetical protein